MSGAKAVANANPRHGPAETLRDFLNDIDGFARVTPIIIGVSSAILRRIAVEHAALEQRISAAIDGSDLDTVKAALSDMDAATAEVGATTDLLRLADSLGPSMLVTMVSRFDALMSRMLRFAISKNPHIIDHRNVPFLFRELLEIGSIEAAKELIVERDIDEILRKSHADHFEEIEKIAGVPFKPKAELMQAFVELTGRRNLFVHTGGEVSSQYLKVCQKHGCITETNLKVGDRVKADQRYLEAARDCLFEIGVGLVHVVWRKLEPASLQKADDNLNSVTLDLLMDDRFSLCQRILEFAVNIPGFRFSDAENRLIATINLAQCYKWQNNVSAVQAAIEKEDWSSTSDKFKLAGAVLEDRYDDACAIMKRIVPSNEMDKSSYLAWPLFREFRRTPQFAEAFETVFGEEYEGAPPASAKSVAVPPATGDPSGEPKAH